MKKIFAILSVAAVALMTVVSCEKEKEAPHQPGQPDVANCYGVFFPVQEATGYHIYDPTQDLNATFTIGRTNSQGAITVPVVVEASADNVFEIATISFADGQTETTFDVNMKNVEDGKQYDLHLEVTDPQYASLYAAKTTFMDFSFMRVEMLTLKEPDGVKDAVVTMTVNNDFLADFGYEEPSYTVTGTIQYYEVNNVRYAELVPIEHPVWFSDATIKFNWYTKVSYTVGEKDVQPIEVPSLYTGYDLPGEAVGMDVPCPVFAKDYYHYWIDRGESLGTFAEFVPKYGASYPLGYYDGNGGFFFNLIYTIEGTSYWYGYCENSVVAIASGYSRVDYSLELEADYPYDGETPIYIETGLDVENLKYAIYEGELSKIQIENKVAAIIDGSEASTEFSDFKIDEEEAVKYATLYVSPEETGLYTLVAVAFDKDKKAQNNGSVTFNFVSADDQEEYKVNVDVFTEDTPARYASYHKYDSFAYGIVGKDLTEVHMGIFKYESVAKNPNAYFNAVKVDEKGSYVVSEETLAEINGEGGYYTVATGMPAKTELAIIVWATNGDMETWVVDFYTTDPLPYVWNSLGVGVYTEDVAGGLYGIGGIDVEANVYEEAVTPGLYMINGFQENYIQTLFNLGVFGESMIGASAADYEGVLWRNSNLIIDATDPTNVVIELQDYGICLSPSEDGFIDGLTSLYKGEPFSVGTLEDGVITFPTKKGLLCTLNGEGYFYANQDGAFKLILPAENPAAAKANVNTAEIQSLATESFFKKMDKVSFERDPQPVKASVEVNYTRKECGKTEKTIAKSKAVTELR